MINEIVQRIMYFNKMDAQYRLHVFIPEYHKGLIPLVSTAIGLFYS